MEEMYMKVLTSLAFLSAFAVCEKICSQTCDGESSTNLMNARKSDTVIVYSRKISLFISDSRNIAYGKIENGDPLDEVWLERSWDGGRQNTKSETELGKATIPQLSRSVTTGLFNLNNKEERGVIRACGKASNRKKTVCTRWTSKLICQKFCDGDDSSLAGNTRIAYSVELFSRRISIVLSDSDNVAYARIENGDPTDEVWIDRSWNGGRSWDDGSRLGNSQIPSGARDVNTGVFNVDGSIQDRQIGVVRACGKAGNVADIACTAWARTTVNAGNAAQAALTSLMMDYNNNGQWDTTGWWNAANCLTSVIDYIKVTNDSTYLYAIDNTFEKNKNQFEGNFCNDYLDDTAWWGLAWVGAYDITGNQKYLDTAKITADFMYGFTDSKCNGGVYWSNARTYKNAITNELFIKLAAGIHNRINGDTKYFNQAIEIWNWFKNTGMINSENLINDGLNNDCKNNGDVTWTYNQGVILGALVELYKASGDRSYLERAQTIANAATKSGYLSPNGILHEPCDNNGNDCGGDGPSFKGVFARNLGELNVALDNKPYTDYLKNNGDVVYKNRNSIDQYGLHYEGPFQFHSAAAQHSALDMLTAARRS